MSNAEILSSLSIVSGHAVCSSRDVSRFFDKEHFHVLRDIETLLPQLSETFSKTNFGASYYETDTPTGGVRRDKMYLLSKDGFMILTMGYTGKKPMAIKEAYIQAFNEMEALLRASKVSFDPSETPVTQSENRHVTFRQVSELLICPESNLKGLRALRDFAAYMENRQDRDVMKRIVAYICNVPSLENLSARGVTKAVFALWAFLNRFPPMNDDLLCNCSGQCKKEVFNG